MSASPDSTGSSNARGEVLAQLALLIDEIEAVRHQLKLLPEEVLSARPIESEPSFNEIYGLIAHIDETVYIPAVARLRGADEGDVEVSVPASGDLLTSHTWNEEDIRTLFDRVQDARSELLDRFERLEPDDWNRPVVLDTHRTKVLGLAYAIARHDAKLLQTAAYRLHESRLTTQSQDPPL